MKWLSFLPLPLTLCAMFVGGLLREEGALTLAIFAFCWALYYTVALGLFWLIPVTLPKRIVAAVLAPLVVGLLLCFVPVGLGGFVPFPASLRMLLVPADWAYATFREARLPRAPSMSWLESKPPPPRRTGGCEPVTCKMDCENGWATDARGCPVCECSTGPRGRTTGPGDAGVTGVPMPKAGRP